MNPPKLLGTLNIWKACSKHMRCQQISSRNFVQTIADIEDRLQTHLNEKAKSMIVRLTRDHLSDYDRFKAFVLNEYRATPIQLRES